LVNTPLAEVTHIYRHIYVVHIYIYIYTYIYIYIYVYVHICTHAHMYIGEKSSRNHHESIFETYMYMYICIYAYVQILVWYHPAILNRQYSRFGCKDRASAHMAIYSSNHQESILETYIYVYICVHISVYVYMYIFKKKSWCVVIHLSSRNCNLLEI